MLFPVFLCREKKTTTRCLILYFHSLNTTCKITSCYFWKYFGFASPFSLKWFAESAPHTQGRRSSVVASLLTFSWAVTTIHTSVVLCVCEGGKQDWCWCEHCTEEHRWMFPFCRLCLSGFCYKIAGGERKHCVLAYSKVWMRVGSNSRSSTWFHCSPWGQIHRRSSRADKIAVS